MTAVSDSAESAPTASNPTGRRSPAGLAFRRFLRNRLAVTGAVLLLVLIAVSVFAPLIARFDPTAVSMDLVNQPPSGGHWFGTDGSGRDVFARVVHAGRVSLIVGLVAALLAVVVGLLLGAIAGMAGGVVDTVIMRAADVILSFPPLIVVIVLAGVFGPSATMLVVVFGASSWPTTCRVVRGLTLSLREQEYMQAARSAGAGGRWIIARHVIPAMLTQVAVVGTLLVAQTILLEAALSFLGLGVQAPQASWGNMLTDAQNLTLIRTTPWLWIPPGLAIALTVLSVNFVGDGLRDAFDPRQSGGR